MMTFFGRSAVLTIFLSLLQQFRIPLFDHKIYIYKKSFFFFGCCCSVCFLDNNLWRIKVHCAHMYRCRYERATCERRFNNIRNVVPGIKIVVALNVYFRFDIKMYVHHHTLEITFCKHRREWISNNNGAALTQQAGGRQQKGRKWKKKHTQNVQSSLTQPKRRWEYYSVFKCIQLPYIISNPRLELAMCASCTVNRLKWKHPARCGIFRSVIWRTIYKTIPRKEKKTNGTHTNEVKRRKSVDDDSIELFKHAKCSRDSWYGGLFHSMIMLKIPIAIAIGNVCAKTFDFLLRSN